MNLELNKVHHLDAIDLMKRLSDNSIDSIVTDPPYGLSVDPDIFEVLRSWMNNEKYEHGTSGFMGKEWDSFVPGPEYWKECFRVLKPGGYIAVFGGTRTFDLISIGLRMAGFEKRDTLMFLFGTGFPKSMDISKKIDEKLGFEREVVGMRKHPTLKDSSKIEEQANAAHVGNSWNLEWEISTASSDEAKKFAGFGTAIKPAYEPILLCRKPIEKGLTVAENCMKWGTGGLNIDGCRIPTDEGNRRPSKGGLGNNVFGTYTNEVKELTDLPRYNNKGRFPANIILDDSDDILNAFKIYGTTKSGKVKFNKEKYNDGSSMFFNGDSTEDNQHGDYGSVSRFFYTAKASTDDRDEGLNDFESKLMDNDREEGSVGGSNPRNRGSHKRKNHHPTVKPVSLMMWLCRLITPVGGTILDPFSGSGSTGKAAMIEGFNFIGSDLELEYVDISNARIIHAKNNRELLIKKYAKQVDKILPKTQEIVSDNNFF